MADATSSADRDQPFAVLQAYLEARAAFTAAELAYLRTMFVARRLPERAYLQRAGDVAQYAAFVARGCLRSYVVDAEGREHIIQFAPETWWLADSISLESGAPSSFSIDAIEDSDVLLIDPRSHETIVEAIPSYATAFRKGLQRHAAAKNERIVKTMSASAEERYLDFVRTYPSIASRVPQRMLASYLGVSPETISRVRGRLARR
jgi:CRP-like cAMP-binding protein